MTENNFAFFSDSLKLYNAMLDDISKAKKYIYLETYKYGNDPIGEKFRNALTKKRKEGVEIKLLIDSWGASVSQGYFHTLTQLGGKVRFFKKMRLSFDSFTKNHRRDHRKLLIIDDEIIYIGSANISSHSFNWRESCLKLNDEIAGVFKKIFLQHYRVYNKYIYDKITFTQPLKYKDYEIIRDVPSTLLQPTRKRFVELIRSATSEIIIETPYFLPGSMVRKSLIDASKRGVAVKIITPKRSDVGLVDLLRSKYLGDLSRNGVEILFYIPQNLHAKLMLIDKETFVVGSANFDYRSFRFQHEIVLIGKEKNIIQSIDNHIEETIMDCEAFNYAFWKRRPLIQKFFEWLLLPFRHLF